MTPSDSAAVLVDAAERLAAEGEREAAWALLRFVADHFAATPGGATARDRLATVRARGSEGSGRTELQVWSTLYGLWLGVAVPGAFGAEEPEPYGVGLLAGGPAGFLAGKLIAGSRSLTEGQARAITLGGTWGTWQGYGWAEIMDFGGRSVCVDFPDGGYCYDEEDDTEEKFAGMVLGGMAGIGVGALLSRRDISPGTATAANLGALWGSWFGFGAAYLADQDGDALLASTLLGGNAGLLGTAMLAPSWNVSRSRARLVSVYGVVGALSGFGLDLLTQPDDDRVIVGIPLAGSILGLALGAASTRGYDDAPRVPSGRSGTGLGALVNVSDGAWSLGTPLPVPRLLELDGPHGTDRRGALKTAVGFSLLRVRF